MSTDKTFAVISGTSVTNVVSALSALQPTWVDITDAVPRPGIGWNYSEGAFTPPPTPPQEPLPSKPLTTPYMSHFGFLDRLSPAQRLDIRARSTPGNANYDPTLDDAMFLFNQAETINVDLQTTKQLVGYLAMTGLIQASDADRLLAPIDSSSPHARFS